MFGALSDILHVHACVDCRERCPDPGHSRHLLRGGPAQGPAAAARDRLAAGRLRGLPLPHPPRALSHQLQRGQRQDVSTWNIRT